MFHQCWWCAPIFGPTHCSAELLLLRFSSLYIIILDRLYTTSYMMTLMMIVQIEMIIIIMHIKRQSAFNHPEAIYTPVNQFRMHIHSVFIQKICIDNNNNAVQSPQACSRNANISAHIFPYIYMYSIHIYRINYNDFHLLLLFRIIVRLWLL